MKLTFGAHKGTEIDQLHTGYLVWMVTRDNLRFKYWPQIKEALRVLRTRPIEEVFSDLRVDTPPPSHKPTKADYARKALDRARKLRELEERRAAERQQRRAERKERNRIAREAVQMEMEMETAWARRRLGQTEPGVIIDASQFVPKQRPADPNDVSDLL